MSKGPFRAAIIGCGKPGGTAGATGTGISHCHIQGYKASADVRFAALADICLENAEAFRDLHLSEHSDGIHLYADYRTMLQEERPDVVSICTWPALHAEMVLACAEAGVKAIHCEKPIAPTFGEARRMVEACERAGVQLTFNHQRRFAPMYRRAKELLKGGAIGQLLRVEAACGNLYDWGTHYFDMINFYNDDVPAEWVIGQIDLGPGKRVFGALIEAQGLSHFKFRNGVYGLMTTGYGEPKVPHNRLIGSDGMIEVRYGESPDATAQMLRWTGRGTGGAWQDIPMGEGIGGCQHVERAILDVIDSLKTGREPELSARRALAATELIFATYESSRRRGRVDLPLTIDDSPIEWMLAERAKGENAQ